MLVSSYLTVSPYPANVFQRRPVVFFSVALSADLSAPPLTANPPYEVPTFLSGVNPSDRALNFSLLGTILLRG